MYTVIGALKTRAFRVAWMLEELGQPYVLEPTSPRDAGLAAINPSLKVPVLKDGDDYVIDSVAICQYLADKHGKLTYPAGTIARAHQDSFTQLVVDELEGALWTAAKHTFVLPEDMRSEAAKAACRYDFERALQHFALRLGAKAYVMGDQFTVPDLIAGHCGMWATSMRWRVPSGTVADYFERVLERPAAVKVRAARAAA
jgi:glutathione S-transferase